MWLRNLKIKILMLVLTSVGGSMLLAGLSLGYFIKQQHAQDAKQAINNFYIEAASSLQKLESKLSQDAAALANDAALISSVNLISEYASAKDYQPLIFDKEKWRITSQLSSYSRAAQISHIRVHDKRGWLISFVDNATEYLEEGILTFKNSKAAFKTLSIKEKAYRDLPTDNHWHNLSKIDRPEEVAITRYVKDINQSVYLQSSHPVYRTLPDKSQVYIGSAFISQKIDKELLGSFSHHTSLTHQLFTDLEQVTRKYPYFEKPDLADLASLNQEKNSLAPWHTTENAYISLKQLPLNDANSLYILSRLDHSVVSKQITRTSLLVISVFIFSTIIIISIAILFSRSSITQPIEKLLKFAQQISLANYKIPALRTGTREFDLLANALHQAAITIENREGQLHTANIEMESRIQRRTADLEKTNDNLAAEIKTRELYEQCLNESREMLQKIMDNIPQYIFWKDTESRYLGCNQNLLNISGYNSVDEMIGKTDYDMPWTREESDFYRTCDRRVMQNNVPEFHIQETLTNKQGEIIYLDTNKIPLHDQNSEVIGILGTFEDVTERKKAELQILQAKEIAEAANTAKSDFLSRMSHELRTPLNAILGFGQLLEYDDSHPLGNEQKQSVDEILTAGNHLLELINDILDLSKIETGTLNIKIKPVSLPEVLNSAITFVKRFAEQKKVDLILSPENLDELHVLADNVRFKQTLLNLLNNAIKYNNPGGHVTLDVEAIKGQCIKISVSDTGIGIAEEFQDRVFTPFDRLGADARAFDGTGIGLVICKQLVELMNGEIGFTSKPGMGSTFWFTLPLATTSIDDTDSNVISSPNIIASEINTKDKRVILCIEDNEANKRLIENIITSKTTHEIITAGSAEDAIDLLQSITPDLILMDITLPGMNGIEATRIIKHNTDLKHIPVIAISANAMVDDIKQGLNSGFSDYLTKPIDMSLFLETLLKYLD